MASDYLLETHAHHNSMESERVFGDESAFDAPNFDLVFDRVKRVAIFAEAFLPKEARATVRRTASARGLSPSVDQSSARAVVG